MNKLTKYDYHEALDRSSIMTDFFNDFMKYQIVVQQDEGLRDLAESIVDTLYEFQNHIASKCGEDRNKTMRQIYISEHDQSVIDDDRWTYGDCTWCHEKQEEFKVSYTKTSDVVEKLEDVLDYHDWFYMKQALENLIKKLKE